MAKKKVGFASGIGFILAAAGSAVGLGNLWSFPYKTAKNGGAAFVFVYIACVLLIGFVTMLSEIHLGKRAHANPITSYKKISKNVGWCGLVAIAIPFLITCYYAVLGGYTVKYAMNSFSGNADLIVILYLITVPGVALIVGGSSSGSPYAGIGISREMVTMMAYELPFIIILLTVAKKVGGGTLCFSMQEIVAWQAANGCGIAHWSLIPAALAMLLVIPCEVGTQPFDVAEAETEICEGPLVEYSGAPLGVFKLNYYVKQLVVTGLFAALFLGGKGTGIVAADAAIFYGECLVVTFFSMTLIRATCARLKVEQVFKFYWTVVAGLALVSLVLAWFGL